MNLKEALTAEDAEERRVKSKPYDFKALLLHGDKILFSDCLFPLRTFASSAVKLPIKV